MRHAAISQADTPTVSQEDEADRQTDRQRPLVLSYPLYKGSLPSLSEFISLLPSSTFHRGTSAADSLGGGGVAARPERTPGGERVTDTFFSGTTTFDNEPSFKEEDCPGLEQGERKRKIKGGGGKKSESKQQRLSDTTEPDTELHHNQDY